MTLANLTPEDWRALAAVPEGAVELEIEDMARRDRLVRANVVRVRWGTRERADVTSFGHGVIAAARVLVGAAQLEQARADCERFEAADCERFEAAAVRPEPPAGARAVLWQDPPKLADADRPVSHAIEAVAGCSCDMCIIRLTARPGGYP